MKILGIETSCDETAASVVNYSQGRFKILSNVVSSQINIHKKYGGVVPEVASRNHVLNINPVVNAALRKAKTNPDQLDRIAVTVGPGLIGSLRIGADAAKAMAWAWDKKIVGVNHLYGHLVSVLVGLTMAQQKKLFPALALIVSGGHTDLVVAKAPGKYVKIGSTIDDAAGEAFDKVAQLLDLGYPGGPAVSKLALKGDAKTIDLPRPMINEKNFDFSFSGLKTAVLYKLQKEEKIGPKYRVDMCASFQQAVVDVLVSKTMSAAVQHGAKSVWLTGGVAANDLLRRTLKKSVTKTDRQFLAADKKLTTDNAAMIAMAGALSKPSKVFEIKVDANLEV